MRREGNLLIVVATVFKRAFALRLFVFSGVKMSRLACGMGIALSVACVITGKYEFYRHRLSRGLDTSVTNLICRPKDRVGFMAVNGRSKINGRLL